MEALMLGMPRPSVSHDESGSNSVSPLTSLSPSPERSSAEEGPSSSSATITLGSSSPMKRSAGQDAIDIEGTGGESGQMREKKRKRNLHGISEAMLRDLGPSRQSLRCRINAEYGKESSAPTPEITKPLKAVAVTTNGKQKRGRVLRTGSDAKTGKGTKASDKATSKMSGKKRKKVQGLVETPESIQTDEVEVKPDPTRAAGKPKRREKKRLKTTQVTQNTSLLAGPEIEENEIYDEIVAIPPNSHFCLESMSSMDPFATPTIADGVRKIHTGKKKRRDLGQDGESLKAGRQVVSRLVGMGSDPCKKGGIKSSTFARVMRLVAELPAPYSNTKPVKRSRAAHRPPVWAESRQELCEALPYYRAFQSGLYMYQGVAFGYLLDGFPAPRDVCAHNGRVIISHGGGQCIRPLTAEGKKLPPVLAGDQLTTDARVATLVRAWERKTPLVLIAGSGYALLPFKLDCSYVVLGWYWVSHVWTEAEPVAQGVREPVGRDWYKRVKVRFDWVDSQGQPWWEREEGTPPSQMVLVKEVEQTSEARRVMIDQLVSAGQGSRQPIPKPTLARSETATSSNSVRSSASSTSSRLMNAPPSHPGYSIHRSNGKSTLDLPSVPPIDPETGLLTPPITPPFTSSFSRAQETKHHYRSEDVQKAIAGSEVVQEASTRITRRRLPGDFLLAAFGELVESQLDSDRSPMPYQRCRYCRQPSPKLYREGWICLTITCSAYWMLDTLIGLLPIPAGFKLSYDPLFLAPLPTPTGAQPPYDVIPPRPKQGIPDEAGPSDSAGSRSLWRGWVCDNCGRANCRFRWEVWQCLSCKRLLAPIDPYAHIIPARAVRSPRQAILGNPIIHPDSGIVSEMHRVADPAATIMIYHLPDQSGTIYHYINDCNEFADGIFDRYQREAASTRVPLFQRRPLNNHQIRGQLLAQHFAVNSGASYKYNVDSLSLSFEESPSCVIHALEAITRRAEVVVGSKVEFNEILSVLYREGQKMSWHDDGEPGLGPIVAGLSLGSDAVISWRRKVAHTTTNAAYLSALPEPRKEVKAPVALSLTTSHGDIVMMQGREMQKRYQHRVIPNGFRVAATARVIGRHHLRFLEEPSKKFSGRAPFFEVGLGRSMHAQCPFTDDNMEADMTATETDGRPAVRAASTVRDSVV